MYPNYEGLRVLLLGTPAALLSRLGKALLYLDECCMWGGVTLSKLIRACLWLCCEGRPPSKAGDTTDCPFGEMFTEAVSELVRED